VQESRAPSIHDTILPMVVKAGCVSAGAKILTEAAGQSCCAGVKNRQQMAFVGKRQGPGMKGVELHARVRYAVQIEVSPREAARRFGIDPRTVTARYAVRTGPLGQPPGAPGRRCTAAGKSDPAMRVAVRLRAANLPRRSGSNGRTPLPGLVRADASFP
jgi:hypothetical protein